MSEAEHELAADAATNSHCGHADHGSHTHDHHGHAGAAAQTVRDPVCGMSVNPATSKHRFEHDAEAFHFCSAGCRTKFAADPAKYLAPKTPEPALPAGTIYTCRRCAQS
jgi:Cu+-exporting ATPase